jgi:hypothetical protein
MRWPGTTVARENRGGSERREQGRACESVATASRHNWSRLLTPENLQDERPSTTQVPRRYGAGIASVL